MESRFSPQKSQGLAYLDLVTSSHFEQACSARLQGLGSLEQVVREESQRMYLAFSINRGKNNDTPRKAGENVSRERGPMVTLVTYFRIKCFFTGFSSQDLIFIVNFIPSVIFPKDWGRLR